MGDDGPMSTPDPERQRRAVRTGQLFGLVLLATVVLSLLAPPWPVPALGALLAVASLVLGVVAVVRLRRARVTGLVVVSTALGLLLAGFMALSTVSQVAFWREYSSYAECLDSAITQRAQETCRVQLERSLEERLGGLEPFMR